MEDKEYLHVIGLGGLSDWMADGGGAFYYIESKRGEVILPVWSSSYGVRKYISANFEQPKAHMELLESAGYAGARNVTAGRYMVMPYEWEDVLEVASQVGADMLLRDPRPGSMQEILPLSSASR